MNLFLQSAKLYKLFILPACVCFIGYTQAIDKGKQVIAYLKPATQRVPLEDPVFWLTPDIPIFPREIKVTTGAFVLVGALYTFYKLYQIIQWITKPQTGRAIRV